MCNLCSDLGVQTDECWVVDPVIQAAVAEDSTASDSIATTNVIGPGDVFNGVRSSTTDDDFIRVTLEANTSYTISLDGNDDYFDTYLYVRGSDGTILYEDDDGGDGYFSEITFDTTTGGDYYIQVSAYQFHLGTGAYTVSVSEGENINTGPISTVDQMANFLTNGYWGGNDRAYDTTSQDNQITVNLSALTADGQQLARWAIEAWELVADIEFVETSGSADMVFDDANSGAYASSSHYRGEIISSNVNVSTSWVNSYGSDIGSYTLQTYIHEIGHALGLGHQGSYNGSASYANDADFADDSWQYSVMSYFSQTQNTNTNASHANVTSAQLVDIVAIQNLYGASTATAGDDVWGGTDSTIGTYLDALFEAIATGTDPQNIFDGGSVAYTIFDYSGNDTLDFSYSTRNDNINLAEESFSDIGGLRGNVGIARDTVIENARSGSGNDTISGNSADNKIWGNNGSDEISGNGGSDTLLGGNGDDTLDGGDDSDLIWAGKGDDSVLASSGNDTIGGGAGDDVLYGGAGANVLKGGNSNDELHGGAGNDLLDGSRGSDTLDGGTGNDSLEGGRGTDVLTGGDGSDIFFYGNKFLDDQITDFTVGVDTLRLNDDLWSGSHTAASVVANFATVTSDGVILDFGGKDVLTLNGLTSVNGLEDHIDIF
ncbi:MAG: M10 family metallopeptidase C-terminal domain-containing protein [Paracoccaceae bacterium]